ncbi:MAG: hypothetical protein ABIP94_22605 [Planctomycetota bacterium]
MGGERERRRGKLDSAAEPALGDDEFEAIGWGAGASDEAHGSNYRTIAAQTGPQAVHREFGVLGACLCLQRVEIDEHGDAMGRPCWRWPLLGSSRLVAMLVTSRLLSARMVWAHMVWARVVGLRLSQLLGIRAVGFWPARGHSVGPRTTS